ncbi:MAG: hypothetical protein V1900_01425 [Candidatus Aenigmatarchaeota archaeon]
MTAFEVVKTEMKIERLEKRVLDLSKEISELRREIENIEDSFKVFKQVVLKMQSELEEKPAEGKLMKDVYKKLVLPLKKEVDEDYVLIRDIIERQKKDLKEAGK